MIIDAKMDVYVKTFIGASVTTAAFAISGPVGWIMGTSYFIADVAGLWNNSVMMPNTPQTNR